MEITVRSSKLTTQTVDALVVGIFEGEKITSGEIAALDKLLGGAIAQSIKQERLSGKSGESETFHALGDLSANLIVVLGLGKKRGTHRRQAARGRGGSVPQPEAE